MEKKTIEGFAADNFPEIIGTGKNYYGHGLTTKTEKPTIIEKLAAKKAKTVTQLFDEGYEAAITYNASIHKIDKDYASINPNGWVLVRAKMIEPNISESGIDNTSYRVQAINVQSGNGVIETIRSKYQFSEEAIIIAVPSYMKDIQEEGYAVGNTIQVNRTIIEEQPRGKFESGVNKLPYFYTLPEFTGTLAPANTLDKHFGYFAVPREYIICALLERNKEVEFVNI